MTDIASVAARMKLESPVMAATSVEMRDDALARIREALLASREEIFAANRADLAAAEEAGVAAAVTKRLKFEPTRSATSRLPASSTRASRSCARPAPSALSA